MQGYLTALDMGALVSAGMVSINVLFSSDVQVCIIHHALRAADICGQGAGLLQRRQSPVSSSWACAALRTLRLAHDCGSDSQRLSVEQVTNLIFLPALEATTGIPTGLSTDFTKPFISQLKINGEF